MPQSPESDDEPKSALQIAMEKLRRQDKVEGRKSTAPLSEAQKKQIGAIRNEYDARLAQLEIMRETDLRSAMQSPDPGEAIAKLEENYQRDRQRIEDDRTSRIAKVRQP